MNILHGFKAIAAFAMVAALFASCSEDQTSFDVDSIPGKAKIIGSLAYSEGTDLKDGKFNEIIKPAANKKVVFEIPNSSLSPNSPAVGNSTFTTTTNAEGKFEISLPVVTEATVTIKPADFTGSFSLVLVKDNKAVVDTFNVVNRVPSEQITIQPNQIFFADMRYVPIDAQQIEEGYNTTVALEGQIGLGKLRYIAETTSNQEIPNSPYFHGQEGIDAIVTVAYEEDHDDCVRSYNVTTRKDGKFNLDIPARSKDCTVTYLLETLPLVVSDFSHYTRSISAGEYIQENLSGLYNQYDTFTSSNETYLGVRKTMSYIGFNGETAVIKARMVFNEPFVGQDTDYFYNQSDWSNAKWDNNK